jgi:hypothetical protein
MKEELKSRILGGAEDLRYLLNRGYSRKNSLELVGNRYNLAKDHRDLLRRGIFSAKEAECRKKKLISIEKIKDNLVAIDGYNVLITTESALQEKPLVLGDDQLIRDIAGISGSYKITEKSHKALDLIFQALKEYEPKNTQFLFDSPISKSGRLAAIVQDKLKEYNLSGTSEAVKVPEKWLLKHKGVIATSDSALIDQVKTAVDLAGYIAREKLKPKSIISL